MIVSVDGDGDDDGKDAVASLWLLLVVLSALSVLLLCCWPAVRRPFGWYGTGAFVVGHNSVVVVVVVVVFGVVVRDDRSASAQPTADRRLLLFSSRMQVAVCGADQQRRSAAAAAVGVLGNGDGDCVDDGTSIMTQSERCVSWNSISACAHGLK